jgi:serine/threonine-protein kinase
VLGVVYRALDGISGRTIALKVLDLDMLDDVGRSEMNARLQRDLSALSRLIHPRIARVYDVRREGNLAVIPMELVEGPAIDTFAAAEGGLDASRAATAVVQILEALGFAHRHGVIHRDLKPSNVLVSPGACIKITDFGMAELAARNRTQTGLLVGTMQYMAPEQFLGHAIDERCDIHAAGTIFYELLTGESPFADPRGFSMSRVLERIPPPPSQVREGLTAAFDGVIARALAKSPADRFRTADAFRDAVCRAYFEVMHQAPPDSLVRPDIQSSIRSGIAPLTPAEVAPSEPLSDKSIALGGRVLAQFVGPIAIVLSRRAVQDARDERGYFELLAAHLPDAQERTRFFEAVGY